MSPKVTVGLPVYNGEEFVAESIESVLSQDFEDFELIVSDNASTDRTAEICQAYAAKDGRVRYHRNPTNEGIAANFNRACGYARGRYFKWHAADDMLGPGYLRLCATILDQDPGVALVTPRTRMVDSDGSTPLVYDERLGVYPKSYAGRPIDSTLGFVSPDPTVRFRSVLLSMRGEALNNYIYGLMRTELLRQRAPLYKTFVGSDKVLLSRLSLSGRLVELPEDLFIWRHHSREFGYLAHRDAARTWDPDSGGHLMLMGARQIVAYAEVVLRAPLPRRARVACLAAIGVKIPNGLVRQTRNLWHRHPSADGNVTDA